MKIIVLSANNIPEPPAGLAEGIEWISVDDVSSFREITDADAYFDLREDASAADHSFRKAPLFINSVITTLAEINAAPNVIRINAWPGFFEKELWEIAGKPDDTAVAVLKALNKKYVLLNDEPGFVSARIIAMIINEAWFAKEENVSTEAEIDTAMKLGTNYPYGPFEWGAMIGIQHIYSLLEKLSLTDNRYSPAPALKTAVNKDQ